MTITDGIHYLALGNPVSKAVIGTTASFYNSTMGIVSSSAAKGNKVVSMPPLYKLAGNSYNFVRLAGLSGALAVILGALGSHKLKSMEDKAEAKYVFETANKYHIFHTIALLGMPLAKRPMLSGSLMVTGTILFSGILYYRALTGDKRYNSFAPIGGSVLILAWITLML